MTRVLLRERLTSASARYPAYSKASIFASSADRKTSAVARAFLNLPGENVGGIKIEPHLVSALLFICRADFLHRVSEAGSGVDGELRG